MLARGLMSVKCSWVPKLFEMPFKHINGYAVTNLKVPILTVGCKLTAELTAPEPGLSQDIRLAAF